MFVCRLFSNGNSVRSRVEKKKFVQENLFLSPSTTPKSFMINHTKKKMKTENYRANPFYKYFPEKHKFKFNFLS